MDQLLQLHYLVKRVRTSTGYFYFSVFQLVLSLSLLFYILMDPWKHLQDPFVLWVEAILTVIIFIDISIRLAAEKREYFDSVWNILDLCTFLIIFIVLAIFYSKELNQQIDDEAEEEDIIGLALISIRYVTQIARLILMVKKSHHTRQIHQNANQIINLDLSDKITKELTVIMDNKYIEHLQNFQSSNSVFTSSLQSQSSKEISNQN